LAKIISDGGSEGGNSKGFGRRKPLQALIAISTAILKFHFQMFHPSLLNQADCPPSNIQ